MSLQRKWLVLLLALAAGWILWPVPGVLTAFIKNPGNGENYLRWEAVSTAVGFPFCLALFVLYEWVQKRLQSWRLVLAAVPLCFSVGILWRATCFSITYSTGMSAGGWPSATVLAIRGGLVDGALLGLFSLLYFAIDHRWQLAEQKEKARQATVLAHQAQLQMLRYQLNPHFLFNALNSIRAMIIEDPERSRQMVTELAEFLRYSLNGDERERTIGDEVQAIENYLAIQRIRFEERLEATVRVDPAAQSIPVPCFLVHPLVENAVKYGIESSRTPLRVQVEITMRDGDLAILVANTGRLAGDGGGPSPGGTGTGLKNIAQRLELMYPDRHAFKLWEDDGWVKAEVLIQVEHAAAQNPDRR